MLSMWFSLSSNCQRVTGVSEVSPTTISLPRSLFLFGEGGEFVEGKELVDRSARFAMSQLKLKLLKPAKVTLL